jgi:hypothetical protein
MDTTPTHPVLRSLWAGFSIGAGLQSRSEVDPRGLQRGLSGDDHKSAGSDWDRPSTPD